MHNEEELEQLISAYVDGELTQADQQRVRIYLEDSPDAAVRHRELLQLKQLTASLAFVPPPEELFAEFDRRVSVRAPRGLGWLLFCLGSIGLIGLGLFAAYRAAIEPDTPLLVKAVFGSIALGLVLLLGSVARQRLLDAPHDRYRRVRK